MIDEALSLLYNQRLWSAQTAKDLYLDADPVTFNAVVAKFQHHAAETKALLAKVRSK